MSGELAAAKASLMFPRLRVFKVGASRLVPSSGALEQAGVAGIVKASPACGRLGGALQLAPTLGRAGDGVSASRSPCNECEAKPWWPMPK